REVDPQEAAVVTVGMIKGGSTHNIIGSDVTMLLTVRSFKPEVRKLLLDGIARIAKGEAIAAGVPDDRMPEIKVRDNFTPATFNTQPLSDRMKTLWTTRFGKDRVVETRAV
ncbi:amidohydrolase, partial [Escherichia coli]|nr:amidohydrolase [Escherichia coli]